VADCDAGLGRWLAEQRHRWGKGLLDVEVYRELSYLNVPLNAHDAKWETRFRQLAEYHTIHGHCMVKKGQDVPEGLYQWILLQRQLRKQVGEAVLIIREAY